MISTSGSLPCLPHCPHTDLDLTHRSDEPSFNARTAVVAGLAALLFASESVPALAATATKGGQGDLLDKLLAEQKSGSVKAVTIKSKAAPAPAVAAPKKQSKASSAPKPATSTKKSTPTKKPAAVPKPAASKSTAFKLSGDKPGKSSQGVVKAGLEAPVPKGAKPTKAAAVAAPKAKPAAAPVVAAKKSPEPIKKAVPLAATKSAPEPAKKAAAAPVAKKAPAPAPVAVPSASSSSDGNGAVIQAGGVALAEALGVAIASSIVGGITSKPRASRA